MTFNEQVDMLLILGECHKNKRSAAELYATRFPDRRHPSDMSFLHLEKKARLTGNLGPKKRNRTHPITNIDTEADILASVLVVPHLSTREIERYTNISKSSVSVILRKHKFHPYHVILNQEIRETDYPRRLEFCTWMTEQIQLQPRFLSTVLFSDEATFLSTGHLNRHNMHYWSTVNPHWMQTIDNQRKWSINVWCGIYEGKIVGPHFFDGPLNGPDYSNFIQHILPVLLEIFPLQARLEMWFQQDGAPPHFSRVAREAVNGVFGGRWIGRGGPVAWPPRSPDLTPLDFFLWGAIKDKVFKTRPTTPEDMKCRIQTACSDIDERTIILSQRAHGERLAMCIDQHGQLFEHLM